MKPKCSGGVNPVPLTLCLGAANAVMKPKGSLWSAVEQGEAAQPVGRSLNSH